MSKPFTNYSDAISDNYGGSAFGQWDHPTVPKSLLDSEEDPLETLQFQRRSWQRQLTIAQQAAARGLVSPEELASIRGGNKSNWIQRTLHLDKSDNSGGIFETVGDLLNLGTGAATAVTEGAIHGLADPAFEVPNVTSWMPQYHMLKAMGAPLAPSSIGFGFSPSAAYEAWQHKTDYINLAQKYSDLSPLEAGIVGFTGDVLLDPTTYLTFGMSDMAKVGKLRAATAPLVKGAAGKEALTLTRYGTEMYRIAAERVMRSGEYTGKHLLDAPVARRLHEEVVDHMVNNYESVHKAYLNSLRKGGLGSWAARAAFMPLVAMEHGPAGKSAQALTRQLITEYGGTMAKKIAGYGPEKLFQETAGVLNKDRQLYSTSKLQRAIAGKSYFAKKVFDVFDKGWDLPPEVNEMFRTNTVLKMREMDDFSNKMLRAFNGLSEREDEEIVNAIERRAVEKGFGEMSLTAVAHENLPEHVEKAIHYFQTEMKAILEAERAAGFDINEVDEYVARILNPKTKAVVQDLVRQQMVAYTHKSISPFAKQRMIASIAEGEELLGKDVFLKKASEILVRRKRASLNLILDDQLIKGLSDLSVPEAAIHAAKNTYGMMGHFARWAQAASHGVQGLLPFDQVWTDKLGIISDLGFKEKNHLNNRKVLEYLTMSPPERLTERGLQLEAELGGVSDEARLHYRMADDGVSMAPIQDKVRWHPRDLEFFDTSLGQGVGGHVMVQNEALRELPVTEVYDMFHDPTHMRWAQIFNPGPAGKDTIKNAFGLMVGMNRYMIRNLDAPLPALVDVEKMEDTIVKAFELNRGRVSDKRRAQLYGWVQQLTNKFRKKDTAVRRLVPQLPEELINAARASREAHGIWTDTAPPSKMQMAELRKAYAELGFTATTAKQLQRALNGTEEIESATHVDHLLDMLAPFRKRLKPDDPIQFPARMTRVDDTMVRFEIRTMRKVEGNIWPNEYDITPADPTRAGTAAPSGLHDQPILTLDENGEVINQGLSTQRKTSGKRYKKVSGMISHQQGIIDTIAADLKGLKDSEEKVRPPDDWIRSRAKLETVEKKLKKLTAERSRLGKLTPEQLVERKTLNTERRALKKEVAKHTPSKDWEDLHMRVKAKQEELNAHRQSLSKITSMYADAQKKHALKEADAAAVKGGAPQFGKTKDKWTAADRLRMSREKGLTEKADAARDSLLNDGPPVQTGELRTNATYANYEVYLPRNVATALENLNAPNIDPSWSTLAKNIVAKYDQYLRFMKLNNLTPFSGFWGRNFSGNAASTVLATGAKTFDPANGFERGRHIMSTIGYVLGKYSDAFVGENKFSSKMKELENVVITAANGRTATIGELAHEMSVRGTFRGLPSGEAFDSRLPSRIASGAVGAAAGAATGSVAAATTENPDDRDWMSLVGAGIGAALGARSAKVGRLSGIPVVGPGADAVTGLLQSKWLPIMRVGEAATDVPFRVAAFMNEFMDTGSILEADKLVRSYFVDYANLSVFERRYLRRMVPFYAWTKHAIKTSWNQLLEKPQNIQLFEKGIDAVNKSQGADPEDVDDWLHNKYSMVFNFHGDRPKDSEYYVVTGTGAPMEDAAEAAEAVFGRDPEGLQKYVASRLSWPITGIASLMMGEDLSTGQKLENVNPDRWESAPEWLRKLVGYTPEVRQNGILMRESFIEKPNVAYLLKEVPLSAFLNVVRGIEQREKKKARGEDPGPINLSLASRQLLGPTLYKRHPADMRVLENKKKLREMENLLKHVEKRAMKFTRPTP